MLHCVHIFLLCLKTLAQGEIISKGSVTIIIMSMKFPQTIFVLKGILLTRLNCCHGENSKEKTIQEKCVTFFVDRAVVPLAIQKP